MTIRKSESGSGLTATEITHFDDLNDLTESEQHALDEVFRLDTLDGRLRDIRGHCERILTAAGFRPATPSYRPWPEVEAHHFAPDSPEGFAARMLGDVQEIRLALANQDLDRVAMGMFYLGMKWSSSRIKDRHAQKSRPVQPTRKSNRDLQMAQEFERRLKVQQDRGGLGKSETALKEQIGREQSPPLSRSSSVAAINRGLENLSGSRAKPDAKSP